MKHFLKRFAVWAASVAFVIIMVVVISHLAQQRLGWTPNHTVEFALKLAVGAVGLVSWLVPSPFHRSKKLKIEDLVEYAKHHEKHVKIVFEDRTKPSSNKPWTAP